MLALQGDLERHGGALALLSPVLGMRCADDGHVVQVGGDTPTELRAGVVVNAAGLWRPTSRQVSTVSIDLACRRRATRRATTMRSPARAAVLRA